MTDNPINSNELAILNAAEELFIEKGYALTSTTAIARKAGCSQAMVHYYYRSKEQLFSLVFRNKVAPFIASFMEVKNEHLSFSERLDALIRRHFDILLQNKQIPLIIFNEVLTNEKLTKKLLITMKDLPLPFLSHLQTDLDAEYRAGNIRKIHSIDLVLQIASMNVMGVLIIPTFYKLLMGATEEEMSKMMEDRKESIVHFIMNSIKPSVLKQPINSVL